MAALHPLFDPLLPDSAGFLEEVGDESLIGWPWSAAVEAAVEVLVDNLGTALHSVYVVGSVARGGALPGRSDIDLVGAVDAPPKRARLARVRRWEQGFAQRFPFATGLDMALVQTEGLLQHPHGAPLRFAVRHLGCCVWGDDLRAQLPRWRADQSAAFLLPRLEKDLLAFTERLPNLDARTRPAHVRWICKRVVRAGFELVAARERLWTRDLYWCWSWFARHLPEQADAMRLVAEWAAGAEQTELPADPLLLRTLLELTTCLAEEQRESTSRRW